MKKIALTAGAVLALSLGMAPVALAQDDDCDAARQAVTQAETRLENRVAKERVDELAELKVAREAVRVAQAELDAGPATDELRKALQDAKVLRDAAQEALKVDSRQLAELRAVLTVALQERDEACEPEPTTTPAPTPEPIPTTTPAPTTRVVVPDVNIDNDVEVVVPRGGVNTGGGPA